MIDIQALIKEFTPNDWRQLNIQFNNPSKTFPSTARNKKIIDSIILAYPGYDFQEACFLAKSGLSEGGKCNHCGTKVPFRPGNKSEPYKKFCSSACRNSSVGNPAAEPFIIDGKRYMRFQDAVNDTGLTRVEIRRRIFSNEYPTWVWDGDHQEKCLQKIAEIDPRLCDYEFVNDWKQSGATFGELCESLNRHSDTVRCAMVYHGIDTDFEQISPEAAIIRDSKDLLQEMYSTKTTDEIASELGVTPKAVQNWLHAHDIEIDYSKSQSAIEREFISYIEELVPGIEIIPMCRSVIQRAELDIYLPEYKLAIEFDGLRFHAEKPTIADKNKHAKKQKACFAAGIRLLNFTDVGETIDLAKRDIAKSIVASKLGKTSKIYARKCELIEVDGKVAAKFFNENHISGNRPTSRYIGLEFDGELVMLMSFGKPIASKKYDWEIVRMACKKYHTVIGGASKIFKRFLDTTTGSVMSYANLRFGNGNVYRQLGFTYVKNTGPGYQYTNMRQMFSRHQFQKHCIAKVCPDYDPTLTEFQNAEAAGYTVYWDSGHLLFEYIR